MARHVRENILIGATEQKLVEAQLRENLSDIEYSRTNITGLSTNATGELIRLIDRTKSVSLEIIHLEES